MMPWTTLAYKSSPNVAHAGARGQRFLVSASRFIWPWPEIPLALRRTLQRGRFNANVRAIGEVRQFLLPSCSWPNCPNDRGHRKLKHGDTPDA